MQHTLYSPTRGYVKANQTYKNGQILTTSNPDEAIKMNSSRMAEIVARSLKQFIPDVELEVTN